MTACKPVGLIKGAEHVHFAMWIFSLVNEVKPIKNVLTFLNLKNRENVMIFFPEVSTASPSSLVKIHSLELKHALTPLVNEPQYL